MRKLIFVGSIVVGAAIGLLSTLGDDWSLKLFMVSLGALVGTAVGGGLSKMGRGGSYAPRKDHALSGLGATPDDVLDNYWRDEGHPQFMKPPSPDDKQFGGSGAMSE